MQCRRVKFTNATLHMVAFVNGAEEIGLPRRIHGQIIQMVMRWPVVTCVISAKIQSRSAA